MLLHVCFVNIHERRHYVSDYFFYVKYQDYTIVVLNEQREKDSQ